MVCTMGTYVEMAEQGWSDEDINLLKQEVELARQEAKAKSYNSGATKSEQDRAMELAEAEIRKIAHDRFHAKLADYMHEIRSLGKAKKMIAAGLGTPKYKKLSDA